jgi:hypothetical protein
MSAADGAGGDQDSGIGAGRAGDNGNGGTAAVPGRPDTVDDSTMDGDESYIEK